MDILTTPQVYTKGEVEDRKQHEREAMWSYNFVDVLMEFPYCALVLLSHWPITASSLTMTSETIS
jgi:hypothetical protein